MRMTLGALSLIPQKLPLRPPRPSERLAARSCFEVQFNKGDVMKITMTKCLSTAMTLGQALVHAEGYRFQRLDFPGATGKQRIC